MVANRESVHGRIENAVKGAFVFCGADRIVIEHRFGKERED